jgi:hypothetical protein
MISVKKSFISLRSSPAEIFTDIERFWTGAMTATVGGTADHRGHGPAQPGIAESVEKARTLNFYTIICLENCVCSNMVLIKIRIINNLYNTVGLPDLFNNLSQIQTLRCRWIGAVHFIRS